jgi:phosphate transport system substrate-binding protein
MAWRTLLFTVVSLSAASAAAPQQPLRVAGTGSAVAALHRLGAEAGARDPAIRIHVLPSLGSTGAIRAVADGAIDLAVSGRPLRGAERALGIVSREVARTPFLFAVGPQVGATSLTTDDLVAIYLGTLVTWPDGQRIRVVLRPSFDSDTRILDSISPGVAAAVEGASRRPGMLLAVTNVECNEILARSPGSVGPTSLLQLRAETHPLRPLQWNGVEPTLENLASGRYPLAKSIHLVFRAPTNAGVRRFLAFLASPAARALLREMGALPVDFPPVD